MIDTLKNEDILFLDIETVSQYKSFDDLDETGRELWAIKSKFISNDDEAPFETYGKSAIYAEFGKIICISVGYLVRLNEEWNLRTKSFFGHDEKQILTDFTVALQKFSKSRRALLCAHNGKEFDFPYIARRMIINGLKPPPLLNVAGKKSWETPFLDTMELWKFGDYKNYTSLKLLSYVLGVNSPKDDIDGSQVGQVYWEHDDLPRIVRYCERDVVAVVQLFLRYKVEPCVREELIESFTTGV